MKLLFVAARRFGRFAILLFVAPVVGLFAPWLSLLDANPILFAVSAVLMLPLSMIAVAMMVGTLFAGGQGSSATGISKAEAPGLWELWEDIAGAKRAKRTVIMISNELNAGVAIRRRLFGLRRARIYLFIGLPLLAVTDREALAAILAHEDAHLLNRDVNGCLNLAEFEATFAFVFAYAPPESTVSGSLLNMLLGWLAKPLAAENIRLSREAELKADRHAAQSGEAKESARALLLLGAADDYFDEAVFQPLKRELMGAAKPPKPPLQRLLSVASQLSDTELLQAHARKASAKPGEIDDDHPSCAERLAALGYDEIIHLDPVSEPALSKLVDQSVVQQMVVAFDDDWTMRVANSLQ
ncbi:M48 family metalloprotease [Labrenzia sp. PO1]|uniref:M48 family metallopeptidase n=1 Tax=unclassified Labrenzia TaxID=2648686 RepID=UPI00144786A3|nr:MULTISPECIES: M48 family metallopeptidase [unclassified Labrenzia]MBO9458118.1 M48 family metallopeptidase [Labrenzia sp. R5_0]MCR9280311.1 M48 family metallopeptidase [Paracoccaceae bacterium]NKI61937.1 M48 family metalloprotease [Labrenzia sp. PO1]